MIKLLRALTGQEFGDDLARWQAWSVEHRRAIETGTFERPATPSKGKVLAPATVFYGIPTPSRRVVFLLDTSWSLGVPALYAEERKRHWMKWKAAKSKWEEKFDSHRTALIRALKTALEEMPPDTTFRIITVGHANNVEDGIDETKELRAELSHDRRFATRWMERQHEAWLNYDPHFSLIRAVETEGPDTAYLFCTGHLRAGRYLVPEAMVADFERRNRFRRLVVNAIRICHTGAEAEKWMRALAERSGGTYVWAQKPPR